MIVLDHTGHPADDSTAEIMNWRRTYPGHPDQARRIRHFVACLLADLADLDDIVNVTAELVANALRHTRSGQPGGHLTIEIRRWPGHCITLAVTDQGGPRVPRVPQPVDDDLLAERGRGLMIVDATATSWGWTGDTQGRTITALFLGPDRTADMPTFTVTVAGSERHNREAPFTYCLEALSREEAIKAAMEYHLAELDEEAADDLIVVEGETYLGEPRGGYHWNDLREADPTRSDRA
ncbi:MAG: serine/threonine-protein kinase RsbW [Streptosporangiaceae bacterium]|jgi:serine/threonine-protein kinase RsbW|nr:serine/threonine-protein kinase RsbW [Streptosporangiaceae bacterium]